MLPSSDGSKENGDGDKVNSLNFFFFKCHQWVKLQFFFFFSFECVKQGGGIGINGDGSQNQDSIDYAAKTHELQTIIEKQVGIYCFRLN